MTVNRGLSFALLLAAGVGLLWGALGCGSGPSVTDTGIGSGLPSGDFGATQGGVQDMGLARELVGAGRVPPPEAFVVEGMFSEHDLGLTGDVCQRVLCLRAALGIAPDLGGNSTGWLQVGMSSTIDPDTFVRPTLTVIATVDVSGSMGWEYARNQDTQYPTAGQVSRNLLSAIAAELNADDRIAIVTYGTTVQTPLDLTPGDDQVFIQAAIDALSTSGVTDMESGLRRSYEIARGAAGSTEQVRIILFTDMQPNVGATTPSQFDQIVRAGAAEGTGITIMGVGVGLGQELMNAMAKLRGGNAFSLFDNEDVPELMEDSWPWLVSPIAYDMAMEVTPAEGFNVTATYGFPGGQEGEKPKLDVSTVFLSKRKGALLLQLSPQQQGVLDGLGAQVDLTYTTPQGESVQDHLEAAYNGEPLDERGQFFQQPSVGVTVALAILVTGMHDAAEQYATDPQQAIATLTAVVQRFTGDLEALNDQLLAPELQLARDLLQLMKQGAAQGDLYGQLSG